MRVLSARDLQRVSWLNKYSEKELIEIKRDKVVAKALAEIGFDVSKPIQIYASVHRDLAKHVALGYVFAGEVLNSRKFLTSNVATLTDVLCASANHDVSLTEALAQLAGKSPNYCHTNPGDENKELFKDQYEVDWQNISYEILIMNQYRDKIRGPAYNSWGSPTTASEYADWLKSNRKIHENS
jgi:hypothetical protein